MNTKVLRTMQRIVSIIMAFAMAVLLVNPISAEAKTKTLNLKSADISNPYVSYIGKTATTVTKTGSYKIVQKKQSDGTFVGYIKFVAPKGKNYSFTLSNLKCKGNEQIYGAVQTYFHDNYSDSIKSAYTKTKGGSKTILQLAHKKLGSDLITKRTGKITLKKGQVLYLRYQFGVAQKTKGKKLTSKLVIK